MGNKHPKQELSIGERLQRKADDINKQKFLTGSVIEKLKLAAQQGNYHIDVASTELGPLGEQILTGEGIIIEHNGTMCRIYIRK